MSYLGTVIHADESVDYEGRLHWIIFAPTIGFLVLELAAVGVVIALPEYQDVSYRLTILFLIAAGGSLVKAWLQQWSTEIAITNRRVIFKTGIIRRRTIEMNREKIESVDVTQSILGRILDYGTVTIRGTGAGIEPLGNVAEPLKLRSFLDYR